jgi:hypothetical protein
MSPVFFSSITIETYNSNTDTWTNLVDVLSNPHPRGDRGIKGNGPTDVVEDPGKFTFSVDNGEHNSQGELGYYSIGAGAGLINPGLRSLPPQQESAVSM